MSSKKVSSADNQQERLKTIGWIVGFVDGEGCFTVGIFKNPRAKRKFLWQVFPEFVVSQGEKSLGTLQYLQSYFQCGSIIKNKRKDNHHEDMYKYCVRSIRDLTTKIIPFFAVSKLKSAKYQDFLLFRKIVSMMKVKKHLSKKGLINIAKLALKMNRRKRKPKFLEILRGHTSD